MLSSSLPLYTDWNANILVVVVTLLLVSLAVLIHYEGLSLLNQWLRVRAQEQRRKLVLYSITGVICLHLLEIWLFGIAYYVLQLFPACGYIKNVSIAQIGRPPQHFLDDIYFSSVVFSSVGFGDLIPVGPIRFMAGTQGLVGLVLIGWSASFTYLEMQRNWPLSDQDAPNSSTPNPEISNPETSNPETSNKKGA